MIGDAGLFVSPENADAFAKAMKQIVEDPTFKETLNQKGLARTALFDWKKTAEKTWEVLKGLV